MRGELKIYVPLGDGKGPDTDVCGDSEGGLNGGSWLSNGPASLCPYIGGRVRSIGDSKGVLGVK